MLDILKHINARDCLPVEPLTVASEVKGIIRGFGEKEFRSRDVFKIIKEMDDHKGKSGLSINVRVIMHKLSKKGELIIIWRGPTKLGFVFKNNTEVNR